MNYYRITTQIVNADTGAVINTGATCYGNFGSSAGTSSTNQLTVGGTKNVSSSSDNLYLNAVVASGYTFAKWSCYCSEFSSSKRTQEFTVNPFTSNNNWNLKDVVGGHTSSGNRLDLTVTLCVSPVKYTLTYNANGGTSTPSSQTATSGSSITLAGAITRSGYSFGGWSIGGRTYAAGASYTLTANATATAVWNALATYTVIFSDGGSNVATITAKYGETIGYGGKYAWPTISPPSGYTLSGWSIGGTLYTSSQSYTVTGNATATAVISGSSATLYALTNSAAVAGSDYIWNCTLVIKQSGVTAALPDGYDLIPSSSAVKVSKAGIKFYTGTEYSPGNYKVISGLNLDISTSFKGQTVSVTGRRSVGGMIYTSSGGYASDDTLFVINAPEGYRAYGWIWGKGYNYQNASTGFLLGDTFPLRLWGFISQEHQYHALVPVLIKVHKVTFDTNGGTGGPSPVDAVHGEN